MSKRVWTIVAMTAVVVGVAGGAGAGQTKAQRCEAAKNTAAAAKVSCLLQQRVVEIRGGVPNVAKCAAKFTSAYTRAEVIAGPGVCPTEGDAVAMEAQIDAGIDAIVAVLKALTPAATHELPATGQTAAYLADLADGVQFPIPVPDDGTTRTGAALSYTDNGDGTITDNNTGLMWEKKSANGGLHDRENVYRWSGDGSQETIWDWLADVNAEGGPGFAGYSDWRIPNIRELLTIVDYGHDHPTAAPAFNSGCVAGCTGVTCSCTDTYPLWSSTTYYPGPDIDIEDHIYAWTVDFAVGEASAFFGKTNPLTVRAVRGGRRLITHE